MDGHDGPAPTTEPAPSTSDVVDSEATGDDHLTFTASPAPFQCDSDDSTPSPEHEQEDKSQSTETTAKHERESSDSSSKPASSTSLSSSLSSYHTASAPDGTGLEPYVAMPVEPSRTPTHSVGSSRSLQAKLSHLKRAVMTEEQTGSKGELAYDHDIGAGVDYHRLEDKSDGSDESIVPVVADPVLCLLADVEAADGKVSPVDPLLLPAGHQHRHHRHHHSEPTHIHHSSRLSSSTRQGGRDGPATDRRWSCICCSVSQSTIVGCLPLVALVVLWTSCAEIVQNLEEDYDKPYFVGWTVHVGYIFFLPFGVAMRMRENKMLLSRGLQPIPTRVRFIARRALGFACLVLLCSWAWNFSLRRTSVAVNTTIYQSSSIVVFALSVLLLGEKVSLLKLTAVLVGIGGVALTAFGGQSDESAKKELVGDLEGDNPEIGWEGDVSVAVSAVLFGVYEVMWGKYGSVVKARDEIAVRANHGRERVEMMISTALMFGGMGAMTLFVFWMPIIPLHFSDLESLEIPNSDIVEKLILNLVLDALFNFFLLLGIVWSSPLQMAVGMMLTIPTAAIADSIFHSYPFTVEKVIGAILVAFGFILLQLRPHQIDAIKQYFRQTLDRLMDE